MWSPYGEFICHRISPLCLSVFSPCKTGAQWCCIMCWCLVNRIAWRLRFSIHRDYASHFGRGECILPAILSKYKTKLFSASAVFSTALNVDAISWFISQMNQIWNYNLTSGDLTNSILIVAWWYYLFEHQQTFSTCRGVINVWKLRDKLSVRKLPLARYMCKVCGLSVTR